MRLTRLNPLEEETKAVIEGLKLGWDMGFRKVKLECDVKDLVDSINFGHKGVRERLKGS